MSIEVDADEHSEDAQDIHFDTETEGELNEHKIDGQWRIDSRIEVRRKNILNRPLGGDDVENFAKDSAK